MKIAPNDPRVKVIHEPNEWSLSPHIADFFQVIYEVFTAARHFDVKFIPQFSRNKEN